MAHLKLNQWGLSITLVLFVMGLFLAMEWRSERVRSVTETPSSREVYGTAVQRLEEEQRGLKKKVALLQKEVQAYQELATMRQSTLGELAAELKLQKMIAGMTPLKGPGIKVVLDDSQRNPAPGENPNLYIVHDYHLRDLVNLLWQAGAEAISINKERVVATTSIYSSGGTIMVNSTRLSPPFVVRAIGDPEALLRLISDPSTLRTLKAQVQAYALTLTVEKSQELSLPPFLGGYPTRYISIGSSQP
jgi:uncharacterized protein YlxW (UPF0749 family)